jgi:hypothetical protein
MDGDYPVPGKAYPLDEFFTRFGWLIAPGQPSKWVAIESETGRRLVEAVAIKSYGPQEESNEI